MLGALTTIGRWLGERLDRDADTWGVPRSLARAFVVAPFVAVVALAATIPVRPLYRWLVAEDSVIEWSQVAVLLLAGLAYAWMAWLLWRNGRTRLAAFALLVAVGAVFLAGEEISWGQRLFGWVTPEQLEVINRQGETNVHNIGILQRTFWVAELLAGAYGVAVPVAMSVGAVGARHRARLDWRLVPPLALISLFLLPVAYRALRLVFLPKSGAVVTTFGELPEFTLYAALAVFGWLSLRRTIRELSASPIPPLPGPG